MSEPVTPGVAAPTSELDALDPIPEQVKLSDGTIVVLNDLRARQFFKLLRIMTHGALPVLRDMSVFNIGPDTDPAEFGARLLSVVVLAIPDAETETIQFLQSMCRPYGLIERPALNKQDLERNNTLWDTLERTLANPHLDDLVTLIEAIVKRESADIQALGKRLVAMFKLAAKTGQLSQSPTSPTDSSSADSPAPSTFSPASTAGTTTASATSPSEGSASVSPPSVSVASTASGNASNG